MLGAYTVLRRQVNVGTVNLYTRYEMEDVVLIDGRARGIIEMCIRDRGMYISCKPLSSACATKRRQVMAIQRRNV